MFSSALGGRKASVHTAAASMRATLSAMLSCSAPTRVLVPCEHLAEAERLAGELAADHRPVVETDPETARVSASGPVDLVIVNAAAIAFRVYLRSRKKW